MADTVESIPPDIAINTRFPICIIIRYSHLLWSAKVRKKNDPYNTICKNKRFYIPLQGKKGYMKQRILIVDDEDDICMILSYSLQQVGYETFTAHSAEEALPIIQTQKPQLLLLDIMMEGMSGIELVSYMRQHRLLTMPIIFLTALNDTDNILKGFQLGADDYISKPFHIPEVIARVAAVLRRCDNTDNHPTELKFEGVLLNLRNKSVRIDGNMITMTRTEFELLYYLLRNQDKILSRNELLSAVWHNENSCVLERTVDVHITHLRRKLGKYGRHIVTKSGYGYMWITT